MTFADSFTLRRGSSDVSMVREARKKKEVRDTERERLMEGASARTGGVIMQIVEVLDSIQAVRLFRTSFYATPNLIYGC